MRSIGMLGAKIIHVKIRQLKIISSTSQSDSVDIPRCKCNSLTLKRSFSMKHSRKPSFLSSNFAATSSASTCCNDHTTPSQHSNSTQIPVHSLKTDSVHLPNQSNAAVMILSVYRAHTIRSLYPKISTVGTEADHLQRLIQRQETVDAIRSKELKKLRMNEALIKLLLRLDCVPGFDPTVSEARRKVSRRIAGLQEILDSLPLSQ